MVLVSFLLYNLNYTLFVSLLSNFILSIAKLACIFFLLVQLVPGSEVAVAPKKCKEKCFHDMQKHAQKE
jgi:hypothetical protein